MISGAVISRLPEATVLPLPDWGVLVLLAALVLLGSPTRPVLRCAMFTLGYVVMTAGLFAGGYFLLGLDLDEATGKHGLLSSELAQIAIAIGLFITAAWFVWKSPSEATQKKARPKR